MYQAAQYKLREAWVEGFWVAAGLVCDSIYVRVYVFDEVETWLLFLSLLLYNSKITEKQSREKAYATVSSIVSV